MMKICCDAEGLMPFIGEAGILMKMADVDVMTMTMMIMTGELIIWHMSE